MTDARGKRGATDKFSPPPHRRHVAGTPALPCASRDVAETRGALRMFAAAAKGPLKQRDPSATLQQLPPVCLLDHRRTLGMTSGGVVPHTHIPDREKREAGDTATRPDPSPSCAIACLGRCWPVHATPHPGCARLWSASSRERGGLAICCSRRVGVPLWHMGCRHAS
jgi:hypothetical protein